MDAYLTLIIFLIFINIVLTITAVCILVYNRIIVFRKAEEKNLLVKEIKDYFDKQKIRKPGF